MAEPLPDPNLLKTVLALQKSECTEHQIYTRLAQATPDPHNREVLTRIAAEELGHYAMWKKHTHQDVAPDRLRVLWYSLAARVLGITFTIKLMERVEKGAQSLDRSLVAAFPEAQEILKHEESHERELIALIDEERLRYVGSVVLGLNDALVEFTGTLAGLTFALQNSSIIAVAGLITGVAAALSMGASEYLSRRSEGSTTNPVKAAVYTGATYIVTVALLVLPYLLLKNPYAALVFTLLCAVAVIFLFTFYISVAKDLLFWRRFAEMAAISLGIAAISFVIGLVIRMVLHVDV